LVGEGRLKIDAAMDELQAWPRKRMD
jgi:hypothetical protein